MHPVLFTGAKQAIEDEVIPLSQPVKLPDGRTITEIPVSKGQNIWINIPGYNRLPGIFGENVHEFDIDRWLDDRLDDLPGLVGAYGNLATFGHGPHLCIGEHLPFGSPMLCVLTSCRVEIQYSRDADNSSRAVGELRVPPTKELQRCEKNKRHAGHDSHRPGGQRSRNEDGPRGFYPPRLDPPRQWMACILSVCAYRYV